MQDDGLNWWDWLLANTKKTHAQLLNEAVLKQNPTIDSVDTAELKDGWFVTSTPDGTGGAGAKLTKKGVVVWDINLNDGEHFFLDQPPLSIKLHCVSGKVTSYVTETTYESIVHGAINAVVDQSISISGDLTSTAGKDVTFEVKSYQSSPFFFDSNRYMSPSVKCKRCGDKGAYYKDVKVGKLWEVIKHTCDHIPDPNAKPEPPST